MTRRFYAIAAVALCVVPVSTRSQSTMDFQAGTHIEVMSGADICADNVLINGTFSGEGTKCGAPLPVQLVSFTGTRVGTLSVRLDWRTISEVNNYGFYIQRRPQTDSTWYELPNSFVPGHGTTNEPHDYSFVDSTLPRPAIWSYRLKQVDLDGTIHFSDPIQVNVLTSVADSRVPTTFSLAQNYPNPFNPTTTIEFALPKSVRATLKVFDLLGREVATLVDENLAAGVHKAEWKAEGLASAVYLYRLHSGEFVQTLRLVLIR